MMKRLLALLALTAFLTSSLVSTAYAQLNGVQLDEAIESFWFDESTIGGQAESKIIYGVEEVMNFVMDIERDGQMNLDNIDRLLSSMRDEVNALAQIEKNSLERALSNGRIDKFIGFYEYLRRYGREMRLDQRHMLRGIYRDFRRIGRRYREFRKTLRQAHFRVRKHVQQFYWATVNLRQELKVLPREERFEKMAQIERKADAYRDEVAQYRQDEYQSEKLDYRSWCLSNPTDCRLDMEARETRRQLLLQRKKATRVIECMNSTSAEQCFRTIESYWRNLGQSAIPTLDSVETMIELCREDVTVQACLDQQEMVRVDLRRLEEEIDQLSGLIYE